MIEDSQCLPITHLSVPSRPLSPLRL